MSNKKIFILQLVMSIIIFLATIAFFTKIVSNFKSLYYYDIVNLDIEKSSGIDVSTIKTNYNYLIDFLNQSNPSDFILPTLDSSVNGKTHFFEVHRIFSNLNYFLYFSIIFIIISVIISIKNKIYLYLKVSGISLMVFPLILAPILMTGFTDYFDSFHKILFRNDFWLFDPSADPVILILPESFFMHCLILIVFLSMLFGFILYVIYRFLHRKSKFKNTLKYI
ncbi:hypothetical protein CPAST_c28540 [Clostridium pasteurianum DSM 525 = ATCC 6013]|uniref:Integral membrane protein TIGR01906 n=1 Tax=Clostridium pasteurianum DSM 525 = ATCC 6013 TaxID=1262449 RepID=A0A0H3JAX9_CLOPA|nr:TIGR01906 family membrane protein [Clostridium pasteurianum]AJA48920.1 hypothetical protein CPAST_c28540 [Clostridium pasteurianum DSM 525 = ATCC 6013]AJA52908.1 hypothetical protein CLPA_c28540 [Clostridium pasteurianum DSM 525 = ATCC 6013]AOZ76129.1 hypothetical protein AQ983_13865 [Clostridium pasteurianum DSM 525 = ATCC 6013]AOZ79925.1 hypothetical protein AQ984_13860 [Clostridium pasteurianum]ELP60216.1 hypothetical protein F502_06252 [Clostridium pasteurianum DSM 525 = ATCC 6013]